MADLYNLDAELEQDMMGTDDTHLANGDDENELNAAVSTDDDPHIAIATDPMDHDDDTAVYDDTSNYQSMSNVPVALREAAMERQRIRRGGGDKTIDNDDDDDDTVGVNKLGKGLWDTNKTDSYLFDSLQQQQQQEKRDYQIQLQKLPYTHLYHAWVQECHAPELLPYPYETIQQIRNGLLRYENYSCMNAQDELDGDSHRHRSRRQNTNENLNALMDSLLRIDVERVKFLLSDLLKRRIQKITLHPQHYMKLLEEQKQQQQDEGEEMDEDQEKNHLLMCRAEVCVSQIENVTKLLTPSTPNNPFFGFLS
jgi:hypothetical protein